MPVTHVTVTGVVAQTEKLRWVFTQQLPGRREVIGLFRVFDGDANAALPGEWLEFIQRPAERIQKITVRMHDNALAAEPRRHFNSVLHQRNPGAPFGFRRRKPPVLVTSRTV